MSVKFEKIGEGSFLLEILGYACPYPTLYTVKALSKLNPGSLLEIVTDSRPSCETIPQTVEKKGCKVLSVTQIGKALWKITIKV
ncbi:MAG: sulfurtransferase TusA family protein [Candidatus Bathyarchaeia archaeon]|nr:sulfurtransferase TusA family protein [Candidatus Bathyarchaeota archaeon]